MTRPDKPKPPDTSELPDTPRLPGRPAKTPGEAAEITYPAKFSKNVINKLKERKETTGVPVAAQIRRAVEKDLNESSAASDPDNAEQDEPVASSTRVKDALREVLLELGPQIVQASDLHKSPRRKAGDKTGALQFLRPVVSDEGDSGLVWLRMLAEPPCGPWKEAIEQAENFYLSREMAALMGVRDGDFLVRADGQSMEAAGIPDNSLLLMRPLNGKTPDSGAVTLVSVEKASGEWVGTIKHWFITPQGHPDLRDGRGMPYYLPADVRKVEAVAVKVGLIAPG